METVALEKYQAVSNRRSLQWALMPIMLMTLTLGWKYPLLGFTVAGAMLTGIVGAFYKGRYVCGNLCPRGAFFDRLIAPLTRRSDIPDFMRGMPFRLGVLGALMSFMGWRIALNPSDPQHWGLVFWTMCAVTTAIGVGLAFTLHPRAWCSICPMGTMQNLIGGHKNKLQISHTCRECGRCETVCPMSLSIAEHKKTGTLTDRDCLKCPECIASCPSNALQWSKKTS